MVDSWYKKPPLSKELAEALIKRQSHYEEEDSKYTYSPDPDFTTGQGYSKHAVISLMCKFCKRKELLVGHWDHLTVIKCPSCNWEEIIHNG